MNAYSSAIAKLLRSSRSVRSQWPLVRRLLGALVLALSGSVAAQTNTYQLNTVTVDYVGAVSWPQAAGSAFVHLVEPLPITTCAGPDLLWFNYNSADGRTYSNIFLTAKATGMKVYIMFRNTPPSTDCIIVQARLLS